MEKKKKNSSGAGQGISEETQSIGEKETCDGDWGKQNSPDRKCKDAGPRAESGGRKCGEKLKEGGEKLRRDARGPELSSQRRRRLRSDVKTMPGIHRGEKRKNRL